MVFITLCIRLTIRFVYAAANCIASFFYEHYVCLTYCIYCLDLDPKECIRGTVVADFKALCLIYAGLLVKSSIDRLCTRGMIQNTIHLISPGCPRPGIALQVQDLGLKHHSYHLHPAWLRDLMQEWHKSQCTRIYILQMSWFITPSKSCWHSRLT